MVLKIKIKQHSILNDCELCLTQFYSDKSENLCALCREIEGTISLETLIDRQISVMESSKIKYYPKIMKNLWKYVKEFKKSHESLEKEMERDLYDIHD